MKPVVITIPITVFSSATPQELSKTAVEIVLLRSPILPLLIPLDPKSSLVPLEIVMEMDS
jgi:hypothetical protein